MTQKEFVEEIKNRIAKGDVESAINLMQEHGKDLDNELTIHSFKYDDILKQERIGLLSREEISREKTKICWALLELADRIDIKISPQFDYKLAPELEDVLALAESQSRRDGETVTSTRYFFAALRKLRPESLREIIIEIESQGGFPKSISDEVLEIPRTLSKSRTLSGCLTESVTNLNEIATETNPIEVEDMFIDVAKFGEGKSVRKLREHGIDEKIIEGYVDKYGIEIKRRK
jgi:Effector-associated domain 11